MKLAEEIVELLSRESPNIENALTKTKVLLYHLGENQLTGWVSAQLNGYPGKRQFADSFEVTSPEAVGFVDSTSPLVAQSLERVDSTGVRY